MKKEDAIKYLQQLYPNGGHCWLDEQRIEAIDMAVKALQEKPVSNDFEMALSEMIDKAQKCVVEPWAIAAQWKDELIKLAKSEEPVSGEWIEELRTKLDSMSKEDFKKVFDKYAINSNEVPVSEIDFEQELYKAFGQVKDFTLGMRIAKRFYEMGRNHQEPVREDLEGACEQLAENARKYKAETSSPFFSQTDYKQGVIDGAKWQEDQLEKNRLAACDRQTQEEAKIERDFVMSIIEKEHRQPTFDDAIKYGMRLQRENMMKKATEVTVHIDSGNYPYVPQIELCDYDKDIPLAKEGDKYKVILIKED